MWSCPEKISPTVTVRAFSSRSMRVRFLSETWLNLLSAMALNEWRVPTARRCVHFFTTSRTSSTDVGICTWSVLKV